MSRAGKFAVFLRHADYEQQPDTPSAQQLFPLTAMGETQAAEAVPLLEEFAREGGWSWNPLVYSSPSLRSWQTADIVRRGIDRGGLQIEESPELMERSVGCAANLTLDEISAALSRDPRCPPLPENWKSDSHFRLPVQGAESMSEAGRRVAEFLVLTMGGISTSPDDQPKAVLFFGHGASFRHAAHLLGVLTLEEVGKLSMFHARPMVFEIDSEGRWKHIGGEWKRRVTKMARTLD